MSPQETLKWSKAGLSHSLLGVTAPFPGPGAHKVLFVPSQSLWQVLGLIFNAIAPFLPPCCGFSFALGLGVSFFGGCQHSSFDGCSAARCDFGVLSEDECMSF